MSYTANGDLEDWGIESSDTEDNIATKQPMKREKYREPYRKYILVWKNVIGFAILHLMALCGVYLALTSAKILTVAWALSIGILSEMGVTLGAHRLYTHRTYQAIAPLRILLLMLHTMAGQNCMYIWVRDHRQHHKYSDTDADPHNAKNGFFFSHIGWLMCRKHPEVIEKGRQIDMSDLEADPYVMFEKKYYKPLYTLFAIMLPVLIPYYCWSENLVNSFMVAYMARYVLLLNGTWLVNSAAHLYGTRPYDKEIQPVEQSIVAFLSMGEGWHNFHHAFPWDYRAAEFGMHFNNNGFMIELFEKLGWASNLRSISKSVLKNRVTKKGDGSHFLWGFGDKEMDKETYAVVTSTGQEEQQCIDLLSDQVVDIVGKKSVGRKVTTRSG